MPTEYPLSPAVERIFAAYAARPRGSLFISGPPESDLAATLKRLIGLIYAPDGPAPGQVEYLDNPAVEAVRELLSRLSKTRFDASRVRLIVIKDCDRLEAIAQNALLKGLEEPPAGSHFLLSSSRVWEVLPTILSRCQPVKIRKPPKAELLKYWPQRSTEEVEQAYWAGDGWFGPVRDYLEDPESDIRREVAAAKTFLAADGSGRLQQILGKNVPTGREEFAEFLRALLNGLWRTTRAALLAAAAKDDLAKTAFWQGKFLAVNTLRADFEAGLNQKIIALNLSLGI